MYSKSYEKGLTRFYLRIFLWIILSNIGNFSSDYFNIFRNIRYTKGLNSILSISFYPY